MGGCSTNVRQAYQSAPAVTRPCASAPHRRTTPTRSRPSAPGRHSPALPPASAGLPDRAREGWSLRRSSLPPVVATIGIDFFVDEWHCILIQKVVGGSHVPPLAVDAVTVGAVELLVEPQRGLQAQDYARIAP